MWKKTIILTVVCVFALVLVSIAEEKVAVKSELHRRFDGNHDFLIDRREQKELQRHQELIERFEKLRSMALEAEEKSKRLWAEAKELERVLKSMFEQPAKAGRVEEMSAELAELKEAIEHAKREGQHDKADFIRKKAERMTDELRAHQREAQEKKFHETDKRIVQLQVMARQAKQRGEMDKAERLAAEAEELERAVERELKNWRTLERMEKMHAQLAELKEAAENAKREGQHDKAAELSKKAKAVAAEIRAQQREAEEKKLHEAEKRVVHLQEMASVAKERGEMDKAEQLGAEAKKLKDLLKGEIERREMVRHIEEMHAEFTELKEAAERAKREGQHDKAAELHEKAKRVVAEIRAYQREAEAKKLHEIEKHVVQLREMANQAEQRGQMDKVEHLVAEAKKMKGLLKREVGRREVARYMEKMRAELVELKEAAEHAKREGQHDRAAELRKKAEHLAEKIAETAQQGKGHIKKGIEKLHAMAAKAKEAGHHEKAEALLQKAKNLGRHVRDVAEGDKEKTRKKDLERLVEDLRNEVKRLRKEVEELKRGR